MNGDITAFCANMKLCTLAVVDNNNGAFTSNTNVAVLRCETVSATVILYVILELVVLGVPIICPLELKKVNPVGNVGLTLKEYGVIPPVAVTGINAVVATF